MQYLLGISFDLSQVLFLQTDSFGETHTLTKRKSVVAFRLFCLWKGDLCQNYWIINVLLAVRL